MSIPLAERSVRKAPATEQGRGDLERMSELGLIREEVENALNAWREAATHVVLLAIGLLGLPICVYFFLNQSSAFPWAARWIPVLVCGVAVLGVCIRRLHFRWRAIMLLSTLYVLAAEQLLLAGLAGDGRIALLVLPLLALILLGVRAGWIAAAVTALMLAAFTVLAGQGRLARWQVIRQNSVEPGEWLFQGLLLLAALIPIMILLTRFLNLQLRTMTAERQARRAQDNFSRQLITAQENEGRRIAGELHDGLCQELLVIANQAQLGLLKGAASPETSDRLTSIAETTTRALQQARSIAHNLRPGLLQELGLTEAVEVSAEKAAQASGLAVKLDLANVDGLLPPEFELNLFRIVQEALNNVLKHAAATEITITLAHEAAGLRLVVEDNGRGFEPDRFRPSSPDHGLGVQQMSERASMMGGRIELERRPSQGTRLVVDVPVKNL